MICKERDAREHSDGDKFSAAGAKAEAQMAFYLRRAFGDDPEVWVFHDLRLADDGADVAQIDHLVLHRSGLILIESKSVTSKVRILANGEFERLWNNHWQGMSSPIKQAERQAEFLRKNLQADREKLLGKLLFLQMGFRNMPMEVLVAISDTGSIERKGEFPEVAKADMIPDRIRDIVQRHKKGRNIFASKLSSDDGLYNLKDQEMVAIRDWLLAHHRPLTSAAIPVVSPPPALVRETAAVPPPAPPLPVAVSTSVAATAHPRPVAATGLPAPGSRASDSGPQTATAPAAVGHCEKCGTQAEILWGKYGYYWKCPKCDTNMPIKEYCSQCRGKLRLRKDKDRFYKYCEPCLSPETLYYSAAAGSGKR